MGILPAFSCAFVPVSVQAQGYPARAVRIIIPVAPGGATDILTRTLATRLATVWRQQILADNRPGGGSNVAFEAAAKAPADGYTILMAQPPLAANASLYRKLAYDALRDFDPVVLVATSTNVLVSHPSIPVHSLKELIALAKRQPGQLTYASSGNGTTAHLSGRSCTGAQPGGVGASRAQFARGLRRVHPPRDRALGRSGQDLRRPGRLAAAVAAVAR